jgi:hypothetical protein
MNKPIAFRRVQGFKQGADDAGVGKRIAPAIGAMIGASAWTKARRQTRSVMALLLLGRWHLPYWLSAASTVSAGTDAASKQKEQRCHHG